MAKHLKKCINLLCVSDAKTDQRPSKAVCVLVFFCSYESVKKAQDTP